MSVSIPTISKRATATEIQKFARAVKLFLEKGGFSGQVASQIDTALSNYTPPATNGTADLTPPGAPTELVVTGGFNHILMTWGVAPGNVDYYEIYRNSIDDLGTAVCVSPPVKTTMWVDTPPDSRLSVTYYYWVRAVSPAGVPGLFNATAGTPGSTADEPDYLLEVLVGEITESLLYQDLNDRIDLIDTPSTGLVSKVASINAQISAINATIADLTLTPDYDNATTYYDGDAVKYNGGLYVANQTTTGNLPTDPTYWDLIGNYASLGDAVAGLTANISSLDSRVTTNEGSITSEISARETLAAQIRGTYAGTDIESVSAGLIHSEKTARATQDAALASSITTLSATVDGNTSAIQDEATTRASQDTALASSISTLSASVDDNAAAISAEQTVRANGDSALASDITALQSTVDDNTAAISTEATARANGDSALAGTIDTVSTTVDGHTSSIQTQQTSLDGLSSQIVFKIDNNGFLAGYGLASETIDGTPFSQFLAQADRFAIINPSATVLNISSMSRLSSTVTVLTSAAHGLSIGDYVVITGAAQRDYNGSHKVTALVDSTRFRFTISTTPATPATVQDGFPGLRCAKAEIPFVVQDGKVVMSNALVVNLTAQNFVGQKVVADELSAVLATSYQQIIGWLLQSSDGLVYIDMANKVFRMEDGSGNYIIQTPGSAAFYRNGSPAPLFEFNGTTVFIRDPDGTVLLQSGGGIDISRVIGAGNLAELDDLSYSELTGTKPPPNADRTSDSPQSPGWLTSPVVWSGNRITSSNQGTYISSLVAQWAWIQNAVVNNFVANNANIGNGAIRNLNVYGEALLNGRQLSTADTGSVSMTTGDSYTITHNLGRYAVANCWGGSSYGRLLISHTVNSFTIYYEGVSGDPDKTTTVYYAYI